MPLPAPVPREEIHCRTIQMRGYRREDGLYDIEGRITDVKTHPFSSIGGRSVEPGSPLHDMWVRLVIDEDMLVIDVQAITDASPYAACPGAAPGLSAIKGERLAKGWRAAIAKKLAGVDGCTHIKELLKAMGSAAYQSLTPIRKAREAVIHDKRRPASLNSCLAHASDGDLVLFRWPEFHTGKPVSKEQKP